MRSLRLVPLCIVLGAAGCILTSGQFRLSFDLGNIVVASPTSLNSVDVDLNTNSTYRDHKDNLKGLADLALLGEVRNNTPGARVEIEAWLTRDQTDLTTDAQVRGAGIRIWGPLRLASGETRRIDWDASAALFGDAGVAALLQEVKGDGSFTIYVIGAAGTYAFTIQDGFLVLTLDAGV